jgi:hypothetical protein
MLTDIQEETLQRLKSGELTASEKADFFYRLSGILKKDIGKIKDLSRLLDEIPDSNLKKINLVEAATAAMELTKKLVEKLDPPQVRRKTLSNKIVGFSAVKSFSIKTFNEKLFVGDEDSKQDIKCIDYSIIRDLTEEEKVLVHNISEHIDILQEAIAPERVDIEIPLEDFLTKKLPELIEEAKSKGVKYQVTWDGLDVEPPK